MAGLGLTQAIQSYQQGASWRQEQDRIALERQHQDDVKAANQAAMDTIAQAKAVHEATQAKAIEAFRTSQPEGSTATFEAKPFRPDDHLMFRAAAARGDALLAKGRFDDYAKNRAALIPMQLRSRQEAWAKFQMDGDHAALGKAMYDTIPDGRHVVKYDVVGGRGPSNGLSAGAAVPPAPAPYSPDGAPPAQAGLSGAVASAQPKAQGGKIRFELDDGSVKFFDPKQIEDMARRAAVDPAAAAEREFALDLFNAKNKIEVAGQKDVNAAKHGLNMEEIRARGDTAQAVAETRADASMYGADVRADATTAAAATRARAAGAGGGGKGSTVQRTYPDADGYMVATFRDGTSKRLVIDGKPVKAGEFGKRVDKLAKDLAEAKGGYSKTPAQLRADAETLLAGGGEAAAAPAAAAPAAPAPPAPAVDLSKFLRR